MRTRKFGGGAQEADLRTHSDSARALLPNVRVFLRFSLGFAPVIAVVAVFETRLREAPGAPQGVPKSSGRLQMNVGASPGAAVPGIE